MFGFLRKKKREREPSIYPATPLLPYGFIYQEWDLTDEEQERVRFLKHWGQKLAELTEMKLRAFWHFKAETFAIVLNRLNIRLGPSLEFRDKRAHYSPTSLDYWSSMEFSEDGKKLIGWRVGKKD